jgi:hypothetical protein
VVVGETCTEPFAWPAVSKPVPTQLVALPLLQLSSLEPPGAIESGVAVSETVTAAPTTTVALAGWLVAPPAPVQLSV